MLSPNLPLPKKIRKKKEVIVYYLKKKKKMLEDITSTGQTGSVEGGKNFSNSQRKCNLT